MGSDRRIVVIGSHDLCMNDLERFREAALSHPVMKGPVLELIVLSGFSGTLHFSSLEELRSSNDELPKEPSYLNYSIAAPSKARCSLYLDPDLPARIVLEGDDVWASSMERDLRALFGSGDKRYMLHGPWAFLVIWASVVLIAGAMLGGYVIGSGEADPIVVVPVVVSAGLLGAYLSIAQAKAIQPANTVSLAERRSGWAETALHLLTIALGVVSAIIASVLMSQLLG